MFLPQRRCPITVWSLHAQKAKGEKSRATDYFGNGVFWPLGTVLHLPHTSWGTSGKAVSIE